MNDFMELLLHGWKWTGVWYKNGEGPIQTLLTHRNPAKMWFTVVTDVHFWDWD